MTRPDFTIKLDFFEFANSLTGYEAGQLVSALDGALDAMASYYGGMDFDGHMSLIGNLYVVAKRAQADAFRESERERSKPTAEEIAAATGSGGTS